ncbi:MAG: hypothetical protein MJ207_03995 [Bacilli bacterium]|nr:hypothetical protein [Bacilli bacterium]
MRYKVKTINSVNEINWENIPVAKIDKVMWVKTNKVPTAFAQMVFIKDYGFIVRMTCLEANPKRTCTHDNDDLRVDSALEAYFMFDGERYMNLENNANGARKQAIRYNRENKKYFYNNEFGGFKVTPEILNDQWRITINIPLDHLVKLYGNIKKEDFKPGYRFTGNFYKVHELVGTPFEHYLAWQEIHSPFPECHLKEQFGEFEIIA